MADIYDPKRGDAAEKKLAGKLEALDGSTLKRVNVNPREAALKGLRAYEVLQTPEIADRLKLLDGELWDPRAAKELDDRAWVLLHRDVERTKAGVDAQKAKVSVEVADAAMRHRRTMLEVLEYNLDGNARIREILQRVRRGAGYHDLAEDLQILAQLYDMHAEQLKLDGNRYDKGDAKKANAIVADLLGHLAANKEASVHQDRVQRAFNYFAAAYEEVRRTVFFAFHGREEILAEFPSLYER